MIGRERGTYVGDLSFASLVTGLPGLRREQLDTLGSVFDCIRANLSTEERRDFGLELLDAARNDATQFSHVLGAWVVTSTIRTHPDYGWQTKEFNNLVSSGELWEGVDREQLRAS